MVCLFSILVALVGVCSVLISYARYRWLAGSFPAFSYYWPIGGAYLIGPFVLVMIGSIRARKSHIGWIIFVTACVLSAISLAECLFPVTPPYKDAEIPAAIQLECVSCVQYVVGFIMLLIGCGRIEMLETGVIPGIEDTSSATQEETP